MSTEREALRVLWRAESPASAPSLEGVEIRVEADLDSALAHRDWADVLVDATVSALLDGARLRRVIVPWAGLPAALRDALLERPHLRAHNSHYNAPFVAEHMVAMLLALAHRLVEADGMLRRGDWGDRDRPLRSHHLRGARALLLGYGRIGRAAVAPLQALGLSLTALRRRPGPPRDGVEEIGRENLLEALGESDVVLCSLPATPSTIGLLGSDAFAALREGALLVNVGRAPVIDEDALYDALRSGRAAGAALDVWYRYPERGAGASAAATLPAHRPFWELPQVLLSPHRADAADGSAEARVDDVCATIEALTRGEERSAVDVVAGY